MTTSIGREQVADIPAWDPQCCAYDEGERCTDPALYIVTFDNGARAGGCERHTAEVRQDSDVIAVETMAGAA